MDYFSRFLRPGQEAAPKAPPDHAAEFHKAWTFVKNTLEYPDERQLSKGIHSTAVPAKLQAMVNSIVSESTHGEEGATGPCLEYLLKNDVLGILVKLSESDRPLGVQAEVLRAVQNMVVLLDEQFLIHSVVHRAVLRLLRNCVGDDLQEQLDGRKMMGAAGTASRTRPSEYEEDLVNLLCILCSRIRTFRELLMIFFHDKHWFRSEPLFSVEEENEDDEDDEDDGHVEKESSTKSASSADRAGSPTHSDTTIKSAPVPTAGKKAEYEFLLFNYLLRFVHREGKIGDFARAGLLFLMDVAMSPAENSHPLVEDGSSEAPEHSDPVTDAALALAEYIIDGDFSEVLGAGLAAVYSVLPMKLEIKPNLSDGVETGSVMAIGSTGVLTEDEKEIQEVLREKNMALGLEDSTNAEFRGRLEHFLKLLEFMQDILRRNVHDSDESFSSSTLVGTAIVNSILDAVRRTFLENVLYPSILECSDADGSAVAVMSYIEAMISTLKHDQLAVLLVDFLMSEDSETIARPRHKQDVMTLSSKGPPRSMSATGDKAAKSRRRKSTAMVLLEMEAPDSTKQSEYFTTMGRFTLKDLLHANLRSTSQPTAAAAMQLLQTLLVQHCQLCLDKLLIVFHDPRATSFPEPIALPSLEDDDDQESFVYPGSGIDLLSATPKSYNPVFGLPGTTISTHEREMNLYLTLVSRVDPAHDEDAFSTGYDNYVGDALLAIQDQSCFYQELSFEERASRKHRLNPNDPILTMLLSSLRTFFANAPEYNVTLTGILATLALCPDRSLAGWLTFADPWRSSEDEQATEEGGHVGYKDDDDRSIDFGVDEKFASETIVLPALSVNEQARPVVHTVLLGLVTQLDLYRQQIDDFDKYLLERRQGLLFSENLTDALSLSLEPEDIAASVPVVIQPAQLVQPKLKPTASSSLLSFLTPRKGKLSTPTPLITEPATPPQDSRKHIDASPFGSHYKQTTGVSVKPYLAPLPINGTWTPAKPAKWGAQDDDPFSSSGAWDESKGSLGFTERNDVPSRTDTPQLPTRITLSRLLDNVVILEESIKELVAIIQARRSLGIDSLRYL